MKQLLVILLMSLCMSFSKDKVQTASNVDSHIDVYLIDEKGENILAPEYKGKRNFEVLTPKRRRFVKFYDPLSYAPNGYVINSDFSIRIFLNLPSIGDSHSFTYVRFNEGKINVDDENYNMWESLGKESDGEEIEIELIVDDAATTFKGTHKGSWGLTPIGPWSTVQNCLWGQANGYNANALHPNSDLAGCPAVAIGLLCRVWSYPSNRGFEYAAMPNSLAPTTLSNPISRMLRGIADVIPGYSWGTAASGGSGASEAGILTGLRTLGYNSAKSSAYDFNTVYGNIDDWYPVLLGGFSSTGGHIWIADGYSETTWKVTKKFLGITIKTWYEYSDHIFMNWGWYGSSNGWIDQASWPSYNSNRRMWYDLFPR